MNYKIILIFLSLSLFACSKDNDNDDVMKDKTDKTEEGASETENKAEYYVKYHYRGDGYSHYCEFDIVYVNKETANSNPAVNTISYQYPYVQSKIIDGELVCGPFEFGDKASLTMTNENSVVSRLLEIYVSKNNSPFALRKSTNSNLLEYRIDY